MALRPVFVSIYEKPYYSAINVEFPFFNGFSLSQNQRCIDSLHASFLRNYPDKRILEISTKSTNPLGVALSAFNLCLTLHDGRKTTVECAYQSSKVFESGGPFIDLLEVCSKEAKKDIRLKTSGSLKGFFFENNYYPLDPENSFYTCLYMRALCENDKLTKGLLNYNAFTDIVYNPNKGIACQARAAALYVGISYANKNVPMIRECKSFFVS